MFHELRSFFDPQYRLQLLKQKMHASFEEHWRHHKEGLDIHWQRMHEVIEIFASIDLDGDGNLNREELKQAFERYKVDVHRMDVDNLLQHCDETHDGEIDIGEFTRWYSSTNDDWVTQRRTHMADTLNDVVLLQRESLRFDPRVRGMIDEFWDIVNFEAADEYATFISQDEYIEFNLHLQRHVAVDLHGEPAADFDETAATEVAAKEWEFDSQGKPHMEKDDFTLAMFQLVDAWSDEVSSNAYNDFLDELLQNTTRLEVTQDGRTRRVWKWKTEHLKKLEESGKAIVRSPVAPVKERSRRRMSQAYDSDLSKLKASVNKGVGTDAGLGTFAEDDDEEDASSPAQRGGLRPGVSAASAGDDEGDDASSAGKGRSSGGRQRSAKEQARRGSLKAEATAAAALAAEEAVGSAAASATAAATPNDGEGTMDDRLLDNDGSFGGASSYDEDDFTRLQPFGGGRRMRAASSHSSLGPRHRSRTPPYPRDVRPTKAEQLRALSRSLPANPYAPVDTWDLAVELTGQYDSPEDLASELVSIIMGGGSRASNRSDASLDDVASYSGVGAEPTLPVLPINRSSISNASQPITKKFRLRSERTQRARRERASYESNHVAALPRLLEKGRAARFSG